MPPRIKVTREAIVAAGLDIVREQGAHALNARALAARLGVSTQPIFSRYSTMDALRQDVITQAYQLYQDFLHREMERGELPPYKSSGMGYIRFAREERELFKLLFMRDRSREAIRENDEEIAPLLALIQERTGMSRDMAYRFHLEMWVYVHGLAAMIATEYLDWDWEMVSEMLTDAFLGLRLRYQEKEGSR